MQKKKRLNHLFLFDNLNEVVQLAGRDFQNKTGMLNDISPAGIFHF